MAAEPPPPSSLTCLAFGTLSRNVTRKSESMRGYSALPILLDAGTPSSNAAREGRMALSVNDSDGGSKANHFSFYLTWSA